MFFERYDKNIIEEFAIRTISKSYDYKYLLYVIPKDTDNFDAVSYNGDSGLEITLITSPNNKSAYVYEKLFFTGKKELKKNHIKGAKFKPNNELFQWIGGNINEIKKMIQDSIINKDKKALRRLSQNNYKLIELCLCVDDGGWFEHIEEFDFLRENAAMENLIFGRIFIITSKLFLVYENNKIIEYQRKI